MLITSREIDVAYRNGYEAGLRDALPKTEEASSDDER